MNFICLFLGNLLINPNIAEVLFIAFSVLSARHVSKEQTSIICRFPKIF